MNDFHVRVAKAMSDDQWNGLAGVGGGGDKGNDDWMNVKFVEWFADGKVGIPYIFFNCAASITKASTHFLDEFH